MLVRGNEERFGPIRTVQCDQAFHQSWWNRGSLSLWFDASLRFDAEVNLSPGLVGQTNASRPGQRNAFQCVIAQFGIQLVGERRRSSGRKILRPSGLRQGLREGTSPPSHA